MLSSRIRNKSRGQRKQPEQPGFTFGSSRSGQTAPSSHQPKFKVCVRARVCEAIKAACMQCKTAIEFPRRRWRPICTERWDIFTLSLTLNVPLSLQPQPTLNPYFTINKRTVETPPPPPLANTHLLMEYGLAHGIIPLQRPRSVRKAFPINVICKQREEDE